MDPIVTLDELTARLDWELDPNEEGMAYGALDDASNLVRAYGLPWSAEDAPSLAKSIVATAVVRYLRNPDGYVASRAGDESVEWGSQGERAGGVYLSTAEIALIRNLSRPAGLFTAPIYAWNPSTTDPRTAGHVPTPSGWQFPYYTRDDSPWWP